MKILWITNSPCSSAECNASGIVYEGWMSSLEKAVRDELELSIAFLSNGRKQEDFNYEGVEYHSISPYKSRFYLLFRLKRLLMGPARRDRLVLRRVREIVSAVSPDLVHVHGTENCYALIGCPDGTVRCGGRDVPVAVSMQGIMGPYLEKYFSGITPRAVRKYESIGARLRKRGVFRGYRKIRHQAENERTILHDVRYVFGRTAWDREVTAEFNPSREYFTVGEIMRAPFFAEVRRGLPEERRFTIVSTVSNGIYKGFERLLRAADCLKEAGVEFEWTVIGCSPGDELVRISERYTGLKSSELGVRPVGRQNANAMVPLLDSADVYCHVSHIENSPNSVCEAMLRALPVVAADVGGVSSIVENGVTGLLYPDSAAASPHEGRRSAAACAAAIMSLHDSPEAAAEMGRAGRRVAMERHSPATVRAQLLSAYRAILADN